MPEGVKLMHRRSGSAVARARTSKVCYGLSPNGQHIRQVRWRCPWCVGRLQDAFEAFKRHKLGLGRVELEATDKSLETPR